MLIAAQDAGKLYVVNALSEDISVIDTGTDTVIHTIPLHLRGYHLALLPQANKAFVTATAGQLTPEKTTAQLARIDLATRQIDAVIPLDISPLATVHVHPNGRQAFVVSAAPPGQRNEQRGQVVFVELSTGEVAGTIPIGLNPLASVMSPDGSRLYTADWASRAISIVDLSAAKLIDTLPLGAAATRNLALNADGSKLYTVLERQMVLFNNGYNAATMTQQALNNTTLPVNTQQQSTSQQVLPMEDNLLWEIDTATGAIGKFPLEGLSPVYALAVSPDGAFLYAYGADVTPVAINTAATANRANQQQAIVPTYELVQFDLQRKRVSKRLGNFGFLSGLALSLDGKKLYLIGTPGDPVQEAKTRDNYLRLLAERNAKHTPQEMRNIDQEILRELSRLPKTVTVLDTTTGKRLKVLTIGSLPQGHMLAPP